MSTRQETDSNLDIEGMFLLGEGRISKGLHRAQLAQGARLRAGRMAILMAAVTWLPLIVLAAIEGVAWGKSVEVPFVKDFLPYGQFLLAIPVLIIGEVIVGRLLGWAAAELRRSDVLAPEATPALEEVLTKAVVRWRGRGATALLLFLTGGVTLASFWGAREWLTGGWQYVGKQTTLAGWWYLLVSLPVMRFLILRWLWRLLLWAWVLWRTSGLKLQPRPTHPDRAGGLAFLGSTQAVFGVLVFAFSVQLSCLMADAVYYRGADLMSFRWQVLAFVLSAVGLLLLPLVVFAPKLARARLEGLLQLSGTGYHGADQLEQQLVARRGQPLPANEISGLADFGVLYENARLMKPVPLAWRHILGLFLAAALPFLPLAFLVMPAQEVFRTLGKLLI
jgi:hypothetical protein